MDRMQATPRSAIGGLLADAMFGGLNYMKDPRRTQQMQGLAAMLESTGVPAVVDRMSYGEPLTTGRGMTTQMRPETENTLMAALSMIPVGKPAQAGAMALGRAGERMAERVVPQVMERGGLPAEMLGAMAQGTVSPATVFHGSPHLFPRFDSSKIGTGEGAQAYGQGLYLAQARDVGKNYAPRDPAFEQKLLGAYKNAERSNDYASMQVLEEFMTHSTPSEVQETLSQFSGKDAANAKRTFDMASKAFQNQKGSYLYQVDLPDEQIAKMLDYDKPLSKQPEYIKQQLLDLIEYEGLPEYLRKDIIQDRGLNTGQRVYGELVKTLGSDKAASEALRQASIPGIRYLDDGSRGAGKGTSNFVVFPGMEDMLRIEQINEQPINSLLQTLGR
jgi:hypothetical protein